MNKQNMLIQIATQGCSMQTKYLNRYCSFFERFQQKVQECVFEKSVTIMKRKQQKTWSRGSWEQLSVTVYSANTYEHTAKHLQNSSRASRIKGLFWLRDHHFRKHRGINSFGLPPHRNVWVGDRKQTLRNSWNSRPLVFPFHRDVYLHHRGDRVSWIFPWLSRAFKALSRQTFGSLSPRSCRLQPQPAAVFRAQALKL